MKKLQILSVPLCLPLSPPPPPSSSLPSPSLLPHPLQSALDASSRGGLDFQAEPQLALRVIIIHLRVLPPQPLPPTRLASPSPRPPPPPAVQTFLHACSGSPKGDSEFFFFLIVLMIITMMLLIMVIISSCQGERPPAPSLRPPLPQRRQPLGPGPGGRSLRADILRLSASLLHSCACTFS